MMRMRRASAIGCLLAGALIVGAAGSTAATAAPVYSAQVGAATTAKPVLAGWSPMQQKPKMISVTRQCDKVKNGTPAGGHSEEKVRASARAYNKKDAEAQADREIDRMMPDGYHKRHCRTI